MNISCLFIEYTVFSKADLVSSSSGQSRVSIFNTIEFQVSILSEWIQTSDFEGKMRLNFHQSSKLADSATGALLEGTWKLVSKRISQTPADSCGRTHCTASFDDIPDTSSICRSSSRERERYPHRHFAIRFR